MTGKLNNAQNSFSPFTFSFGTTMYRSTIPLRFIWSICSGN